MRAFHSGYYEGSGRSDRVKRLHIMREDGSFPGRSALCGTNGWNCQRAPRVIDDPMPATPPAGLAWCPACVGKAAEKVGLIDAFAAQIAAAINSPGGAA